ncbi:MAG: GNAT family N-acetyltransferase [Gammaproteobacteria bacterium]|jgi:GNAT superfamily N-acetyltransferase|nr:GNAT family N-acetyltransferase [Gammaproteobacteria bacterium]
MSIQVVTGEAIAPHVDAVAELRIRVFRDWPYLYAGSIDYERDYLAHFQASPDSVFVLAMDDTEGVVGCSTGLPLADAHEAFRRPFRRAGYALDRVFYFGESVLDPAWRGRGLGHAFFDERERHAGNLGHDITAFCAVIRPQDHPLRPPEYRPLDDFWAKRGYARDEALTTGFSWQDIDEDDESDKPMQFWIKRL